MQDIKKLLDKEVNFRNNIDELSFKKPDPLLIASRYKDEYISLICALFAYGNAKHIVKFLDQLDFSLLDQSEATIKKELKSLYRFQTNDDVVNFFFTIKRLKNTNQLEDIFNLGYKKEHSILEGIDFIIKYILDINDYYSDGYKFLIGARLKRDKKGSIKLIGNSPYKRYNMFLRWMVRSDNLDIGLWKNVDKKDLILPLDTHTFKIGQKLALLNRKTYDLKSAILITEQLRLFDPNDPIKYDFALYRLGQEKIL